VLVAMLAGVFAGCASAPPSGGLAWVGVDAVVTPAELHGPAAADGLDAARLRDAGLGEADVAAGRIVRVSCSPSVDALWMAWGIVPAGTAVRAGDVVRMAVQQESTNDRLGLNPLQGGAVAGLTHRMPAYRVAADKPAGALGAFERIPLAEGHRGRYREVQGSWIIAC
jgi:hypothetical protein